MDESVWRSEETVDDEPNIPFGGIGASGTGSRFGVAANLEARSRIQPVARHTNTLANATDISGEVKRRFLPAKAEVWSPRF
jgi:hypothetical protein